MKRACKESAYQILSKDLKIKEEIVSKNKMTISKDSVENHINRYDLQDIDIDNENRNPASIVGKVVVESHEYASEQEFSESPQLTDTDNNSIPNDNCDMAKVYVDVADTKPQGEQGYKFFDGSSASEAEEENNKSYQVDVYKSLETIYSPKSDYDPVEARRESKRRSRRRKKFPGIKEDFDNPLVQKWIARQSKEVSDEHLKHTPSATINIVLATAPPTGNSDMSISNGVHKLLDTNDNSAVGVDGISVSTTVQHPVSIPVTLCQLISNPGQPTVSIPVTRCQLIAANANSSGHQPSYSSSTINVSTTATSTSPTSVIKYEAMSPRTVALPFENQMINTGIKNPQSIQSLSRFDCKDHFPVVKEVASFCQYCSEISKSIPQSSGNSATTVLDIQKRHTTAFSCTKCNVMLCIKRSRNCFFDYHNKRLSS